ncbi:MAG: type II secretion system protein [Planctomycetota bacterium]|nr:type II secretion system GspH family protein [Planctomycetota bacterium]MCX8040403.1 type II secretion system GspH family protein [Planctomycetota bacterium]MDW8372221.1 type II secretion system protein [Planctomycetota bacterium]
MRRGFTLAEVLVAIGVFAIAASVMLGALLGATDLFRRGQAARQTTDEAIAVLAALHDDLARLVPVRLQDGAPASDGGWLYAARRDAAGNCLLAFVSEEPASARREATSAGTRRIVAWWVEGETLWRALYPWDARGGARAAARLGDRQRALSAQEMTVDCLHFGVWLVVPGSAQHPAFRRPWTERGPDWEARESAQPQALSRLPPWGQRPPTEAGEDTAFDTDPPDGQQRLFFAAPEALRVSLICGGGSRFAPRGVLVGELAEDDDRARLAGLSKLPTVAGSLLRIGDEWVRYEDARGGLLSGLQRGELRSAPARHPAGTPVRSGQAYSFVVAVPR